MARPRTDSPEMYWYQAGDCWAVKIDGRRHRLGRDEAAARKKCRRLVAEMLLARSEAEVLPPPPPLPAAPRPVRLSVAEALLEYRKAVLPRLSLSQLERIDRAIRAVLPRYAALRAEEFDQLCLQEVRRALLAERFTRDGPLMQRVRELLAPGPMPAQEFMATLLAEGWCERAIWQARRRLGVTGTRGRRGRDAPVYPPAAGFAPVVPQPLSRRYVNALVGVLQTAWWWMAGQKIVPGQLARDLYTVAPLAEHQGGRETAPVQPADPAAVRATLPFLGPVVRAMVEVHRLTGMRPEEVCNLRRCDLSLAPDEKVLMPLPDGKKVAVAAVEVEGQVYWVYAPPKHKTRGKRKWKAVVIPPAAQAWLLPFFAGRPADAYLFSPREASDDFRARKERSKRYGRGRQPGDCYTPASYREAVKRAARAAGVVPWVPAQLRHSVATAALEVGSDHEVAALLGHASTDLVSTYAAQAVRKAAELAARLAGG